VRLVTEADGATLARAERWGDGFDLHIDFATGPDGALYAAAHGGRIARITYQRDDLGVVVSPQNLRLNEGGRGIVGIRLSRPPGEAVSIQVQRSGGDGDVDVISFPTTLPFDNANWDRPQYAESEATVDGDGDDDVATLSVSGAGVGGETVTVRVTDLAAPQPPPDAGVPDAAPGVDAGPDAPRPPDASPTADAQPTGDGGMTGDADSGCDCRAGNGGSIGGALLLALALLWLRRRG
jgi:MYXO-CTERM domain-containing protein